MPCIFVSYLRPAGAEESRDVYMCLPDDRRDVRAHVRHVEAQAEEQGLEEEVALGAAPEAAEAQGQERHGF